MIDRVAFDLTKLRQARHKRLSCCVTLALAPDCHAKTEQSEHGYVVELP
jgi:hypothetical protein